MYLKIVLQKVGASWVPVTLATWEAEIGRIEDQGLRLAQANSS
jgi:hypothetical protein